MSIKFDKPLEKMTKKELLEVIDKLLKIIKRL